MSFNPTAGAISQEMFNYGVAGIGDNLPKDLGFAGFDCIIRSTTGRIMMKLSCFSGRATRAVGAKRSSVFRRGLAIDTAEESGEEFHQRIWLIQPAPGADRITIYALLDSPRRQAAMNLLSGRGKRQ
jgi:glucans biosynthesis protein